MIGAYFLPETMFILIVVSIGSYYGAGKLLCNQCVGPPWSYTYMWRDESTKLSSQCFYKKNYDMFVSHWLWLWTQSYVWWWMSPLKVAFCSPSVLPFSLHPFLFVENKYLIIVFSQGNNLKVAAKWVFWKSCWHTNSAVCCDSQATRSDCPYCLLI